MSTNAGYNGAVYIAAQASVALSNEACTDLGTHQSYQVTNTAHRYLDDSVAVVVQTSPDGTTWTTQGSTTYTIQYVGGIVTFTSAKAAGTQTRLLSGSYLPISQVATADAWELDTKLNLAEVSVFGSGWKSMAALPAEASGSFHLYQQDNTFLVPGTKLVLKLYTDFTNNKRYEFFAYIAQDQVKSDVGAIADETVNFTVTSNVYYATT